MKWTMIAAILSATVLLGAAWGAAAAPQYLSNYAGPHPVHLDSEESAHYHFHHFHHHHHELQHMEVSSRSAELEDPGAEKRPPPVGLMLITQNPIGLCRADNTTCSCLNEMSEKRLSECGDTYPLWTVDSLWQGNIPRPRTKQPLDIRACNEHNLSESSAITELNELSEEEHECLRSVWPPLKEEGDCSEDSAIIYEGTVQGNCSLIYEGYSLKEYYRQVASLYVSVNGASGSCKGGVRACGNHTATSDVDSVNTSPPFPLPTDGPALNEKIHIALMDLGLTNDKRKTIDPSALKDSKFGFNVYLGCMQSSHGGINSYILTRVGFCFKCPKVNQPCDMPLQVDCWTDAMNPPPTVPWAHTNGDVPCYTGKKRVCYCGYDKLADCRC